MWNSTPDAIIVLIIVVVVVVVIVVVVVVVVVVVWRHLLDGKGSDEIGVKFFEGAQKNDIG